MHPRLGRMGPIVVCAMFFALFGAHAHSQTRIIRQVIGSGAAASISPTHAMAGTVGQTIIGRSASSSHIGYLGFWFTYPNPNNPNAVREEYSPAVTGATAAVRVAPNPVTDVATVSVVLPSSGMVRLSLFDGLGQQRLELINSTREAGTITVQLPARELESGDYLLVLLANGTRSVTPLRVIK
jgi:hypothetical protein